MTMPLEVIYRHVTAGGQRVSAQGLSLQKDAATYNNIIPPISPTYFFFFSHSFHI